MKHQNFCFNILASPSDNFRLQTSSDLAALCPAAGPKSCVARKLQSQEVSVSMFFLFRFSFDQILHVLWKKHMLGFRPQNKNFRHQFAIKISPIPMSWARALAGSLPPGWSWPSADSPGTECTGPWGAFRHPTHNKQRSEGTTNKQQTTKHPNKQQTKPFKLRCLLMAKTADEEKKHNYQMDSNGQNCKSILLEGLKAPSLIAGLPECAWHLVHPFCLSVRNMTAVEHQTTWPFLLLATFAARGPSSITFLFSYTIYHHLVSSLFHARKNGILLDYNMKRCCQTFEYNPVLLV